MRENNTNCLGDRFVKPLQHKGLPVLPAELSGAYPASAGDCPGCWWGLLRYGGALGYGPHHAARAAGAGTVSRSGGRLGVVRPTPRPPVRAAPIGAALLQHLPPLPACPGAGRPAALAADDRSPEITPGFPPGLFHAWAAQTSPFAVPCPGTVATPGPYVLPQGGRPPTLGGRSCDLVHAFRQ